MSQFIELSSLPLSSTSLPSKSATTAPSNHKQRVDQNSFEQVVRSFIKSQRVVIMTGAGISTSAGVPDFRSQTGLYTSAAPPSASSLSSPSSPHRPSKPRGSSANVQKMFDASVYSSPVSRAEHLTFMANFKSSLDTIMEGKKSTPLPKSNKKPILRNRSPSKVAPVPTARLSPCSSSTNTPAVIRETLSNDITSTHAFLKLLKRKKMLKRIYTQNIDGFEFFRSSEFVGETGLRQQESDLTTVQTEGNTASIPLGVFTPFASPSPVATPSRSSLCSSSNKSPTSLPFLATTSIRPKSPSKRPSYEGDVVQLHGSLQFVRCTVCSYVAAWTPEHTEVLAAGDCMECPDCTYRETERIYLSKRARVCYSYLRPSITLYSEASPSALTIGSISSSDLSCAISQLPDFLIVMGTSLKIPGFKKLVKEFGKVVAGGGKGRVILVNQEAMRTAEWEGVFDYQIIGKTDEFCEWLVRDWKRIKPDDWRTQTKVTEFGTSTHAKIMASAQSEPAKVMASSIKLLPSSTPASKSTKPTSTLSYPTPSPSPRKVPLTPIVPSPITRPKRPFSGLASPATPSKLIKTVHIIPNTPPLTPTKRTYPEVVIWSPPRKSLIRTGF